MTRIYDWQPIVGCLGAGGLGFFAALFVRMAKDFPGAEAMMRGLEAFLTATIGAFLAHTFMVLLLSAGTQSTGAVAMLTLLFFPIPGVINLILIPLHHAMDGDALLWLALVTGGLIGLYDGMWAAQNWRGLGWIAFPLDVTWGLSGSSNGVIMHIIHTGWVTHADDAPGTVATENRHCAHRYVGGFRIRKISAFSQGSVMSNMRDYVPTTPEFEHEQIHGGQNRLLGPFFWSSYFGWMAVLIIPAMFGAIKMGFANAVVWWTYRDNPWEVMAYSIANPETRKGYAPKIDGKPDGLYLWPVWAQVVLSSLVLLGMGILVYWLCRHFGVFG
jgi:hypothetical protein